MEIKIPKIGVEDGEVTLATWEKEDGAWINKNEIIAVAETEKVNADILAPVSGRLKILLAEGETARMTDTIGIIEVEGEAVERIEFEEQTQLLEQQPIEISSEVVDSYLLSPSKRRKLILSVGSKKNKVIPISKKILGSPAAKRLAGEKGIDFASLSEFGSGPNGEILAKDVQKMSVSTSIVNSNRLAEPITDKNAHRIRERQKLTPIRKAIARNMYNSLHLTAQMTLMGTIHLDSIWPFVEQMKKDFEPQGIKPSWAAIFIKTVALALEEHRQFNGTIDENEFIVWEEINIGVAVSSVKGLVVPSIKDANKKSLLQIHKELKELSEKARNNKLEASDLKGSTFTLTNVGSFGGEMGTPILNTKEVGILGIGAVMKQPIVNEQNEIVVGRICYYNLTVDHQVIDGEDAGQFIRTIKKLINSPSLLWLS